MSKLTEKERFIAECAFNGGVMWDAYDDFKDWLELREEDVAKEANDKFGTPDDSSD